ncbi:MAG: hypothetical protein ABIP90_02340, partial [Vicinamibacterales bacterium]
TVVFAFDFDRERHVAMYHPSRLPNKPLQPTSGAAQGSPGPTVSAARLSGRTLDDWRDCHGQA